MASSTTMQLPSNDQKSFPTCLLTVDVGFVSSKLWGEKQSNNYSSWKQHMLCLIESQDLLGFIDGNIPPPPSQESTPAVDGKRTSEYCIFKRTDRLLKALILSALSDTVLKTVANCATARDVWLELEKNFSEVVQTSNIAAEKDLNEYLPLYKAIIDGKWDAAKHILDDDPEASKAMINSSKQTALHIAILTKKPRHFVENLVAQIPDESIALKDDVGDTALGIAAAVGNKEAAIVLVNKMPDLLYIPNNMGNFPVQQAALFSNRDMLEYLISVTRDNQEINPYAGIDGLRLLIYVIDEGFMDVALYLVKKYPHVATLKLPDNTSALKKIATGRSLFFSGYHFRYYWNRILFSWIKKIRLRPQSAMPNDSDIEGMAYDDRQGVGKNLFWFLTLKILVAFSNTMGLPLAMRHYLLIQQASEFVQCLCERIGSLSHKEASDIYLDAIETALKSGVNEVIEQVFAAFPDAIHGSTPSSKQSIIHMAVENRSGVILDMICKMGGHHKHLSLDTIDSDGNNLLHAAAKLAPSLKLGWISSPFFKMQHEIHCYREVLKIVPCNYVEQANKAGKTPSMVFEEEHKELKKEAEKWVKKTANSCTIIAALIASAMFAGAIRVPGGNDRNTGFPIFSKKIAFTIYAISNALSLFTSMISLLMFMSILASRHEKADFLNDLPIILMTELGSLFISIASMVVSYGAAFYLVFGQKNAWFLGPLFALATYFLYLLIFFQPIFIADLMHFTFGPRVLG